MGLKPIITKYKGYRFRSRLEARWAVFFDTLDIQWEYEPEGFVENGVTYLPDFYLPFYDLWVEIKPIGHKKQDLGKWLMLSKENLLVVLEGSPHSKSSDIYGIEEYTLSVIPFVNLINPKYGYFWHCGGDEDFGDIEPFRSAIIASRQYAYNTYEKDKF